MFSNNWLMTIETLIVYTRRNSQQSMYISEIVAPPTAATILRVRCLIVVVMDL